MNFDKIVKKATEIQVEASDIHLHPGKYNISSEVIQKGGKDYTTAVDRAVENYQRAKLRQEFPEIGFLGEESGGKGKERYFWIVDPTDGTAVYLTGGDYYSNSIALADRQEKKVLLSSVYQPAIRRQFLRLGNEVWISEEILKRDGTREKIERVPEPSKSKGLPELMGCVIVPSEYRKDNPDNQKLYEKLNRLFDKIEFPNQRKYGMINAIPASGSSALFCCDIASGNRHFYMGYFQKPWDLAGGALFARDAGCIVESVSVGRLGGGDLEQQIATCTKESVINVHVFANPNIRNIVTKRFNI